MFHYDLDVTWQTGSGMNYLCHAQKNNSVSKGGTNKNSQEVGNRELLKNHVLNQSFKSATAP